MTYELLTGIPLWTGETKEGKTIHVWQRVTNGMFLICDGHDAYWSWHWKSPNELSSMCKNLPSKFNDLLESNLLKNELTKKVENLLVGYMADQALGNDRNVEIALLCKILDFKEIKNA